MEISGIKVLVTGADGFIVSHLVQALKEKGGDGFINRSAIAPPCRLRENGVVLD